MAGVVYFESRLYRCSILLYVLVGALPDVSGDNERILTFVRLSGSALGLYYMIKLVVV